jgi:ketosteroid isomerase-like protein
MLEAPGPEQQRRHKVARQPLSLTRENVVMAPNSFTDEGLDQLVRDMADAASAYIRGDIRRYLSVLHHSDEYTLMPPYGGETMQGYDPTPEQIEETSRYFQNGEAELEVVKIHASGDIAVLVAVERQHGEVGGTPDQDWSLRVTLVFLWEGSKWWLLHRHADPLVHGISMDQLAVLARGEAPPGEQPA